MAKLTVCNHLTLDGVMQAPGAADEDQRDGFEHGGWAVPYGDEVMGKVMSAGMARGGALLFGRRTYEQFTSSWRDRTDGNPFTDVLNNTLKYVASTTLREPLPWQNSTLLQGDAADAVAALKEQSTDDLMVLGSGELLQSLMRRRLVDEYLLTIHPLVLGSGRRLFRDGGAFTPLELVESIPTTTGVVIARYQPSATASSDQSGS
jgi:dihydrofolate reductase